MQTRLKNGVRCSFRLCVALCSIQLLTAWHLGAGTANAPTGKFQLDGEKWTYRDGDFEMHGILLKPEGKGPFPGVLISHGLGGSAGSFGMNKAREFVKWGVVCMAPDYTHTGGAMGRRPGETAKAGERAKGGTVHPANYGASEENLKRARTCIEILCGLPEVDSKRIAAYGHSMGGFVTIGLAAKYPDLLKAAAVSGSGVAPQSGFPAPSVAAAEAIRTPFLMVHGGNDNVVRPEQSASLKAVLDRNKIPNERKIFEGEGHPVDQSKREEVFTLIRQWFGKQGVLAASGQEALAAPSSPVQPRVQPGADKSATRPEMAAGMGAAAVPAGVKAYRDLPYVTNGHERQKLDLFIPEQADKPLPVIIWIHGGGWAAGSKDGCPPLRDGYTQRGYAVASIGYRLSGHAIFPAQIEDCKAAIRYLRAHAKEYQLDAGHFGVWGSSAGGHLVAMVGTTGHVKEFEVGENLDQSSAVQAVCDYYGPTDLLQMDAHALPEARMKHDPISSPESRLIGGAIQENKDKTARANPIRYLTRDVPPFLIVHGDKDVTVPHHQSQLLFEALKVNGTRVRFHTLEGAGHGIGFGGKELETMVNNFFARHLKGDQVGQNEPIAQATRGAGISVPGMKQGLPSPGNAGRPAMQQPGQANQGRRGIPWEVILRDDKNNDGKISKEEFRGPPALFERLDRNQDGVLTREEHDAAFGERTNATPKPGSEKSGK